MIVRHDPDPRYKRSYGVVIMSPDGLEILRSHMAPRDIVVLMTLISKLQWFDIDYEEKRVGDDWQLKKTGHDGHVLAKIKESGIVTTGAGKESLGVRVENVHREKPRAVSLLPPDLHVFHRLFDPRRALGVQRHRGVAPHIRHVSVSADVTNAQ